MGRSTVHYTDSKTNTILKALHNKLRPAGTPVQRVEYIIELLLLRIFEVKLKREDEFKQLRKLFSADTGNDKKLFYYLQTVGSEKILSELNHNFFPFYANILNHAHTVIKGNLKDKVQDQLVLIQDVFANSNFTNNVQSGNLEEIVNLIADIDEDRLLKTDLLGDSIESALSETGGTKDIGLFRTPDHVRQFMVGLLQPKITDNIFDPACGTGGFLFDSFGFVTESISQDGNWPGPKAHPELQDWFRNYFKKNPAAMPTIEQTHQFYRSGIYGIEYLGMIRKMAAVNFYIRGLNPHNIEQGDSLAKFNKELQFKNTFSIVLANPPFGAERDQKAYPNVWEEFAKESETTILFVKLMFDALKPGGRCAVVVSEGFLTWDQTSAKTLRQMLLNEANLQAVIGLPQGVFVSKNGSGPKTSILVIEKGKQTKNVWFYNIENDGFTKGANRTPIEGCQMKEALELYHKYIRHGKTAPETRNSFSLNVDWLTVVDPRIKENIRKETIAEIEEKKGIAKDALIKRLDNKLKNTKTGKFGKKEYDAEIYKFECIWQQKLQNEIAKRIDKSHSYSLNSSTYRSNLTEKQLEQWGKAVAHHTPEKNGHSLDKRFALLKQSKLENAITHISTFDPQNAIEADIVREYLANIEQDILKKYPALKTIDAIFKSGAKYPIVKIKDMCTYEKGKFPTEKTLEGLYPFVVTAGERKTANDYQFEGKAVCIPLISSTGHGHASMKRIHYQEGKFALANLLFALFAKDEFRLNMKYLYHVLSPKLEELFVPLMKGTANVGMKMTDAVQVEFPLPPFDKQLEIVAEIECCQKLIEGANQIIDNWKPQFEIDPEWPIVELGEVIELIRGVTYTKSDEVDENGHKVLRANNISLNGDIVLQDIKQISKSVLFKESQKLRLGDIFICLASGSSDHIGKVAYVKYDTDFYFGGFMGVIRVSKETVNSLYIYHLLKSNTFNDYLRQVISGANINNLSAKILNRYKIPIPPLDIQREIAAKIEVELKIVDGCKELLTSYNEKINNITGNLWEE